MSSNRTKATAAPQGRDARPEAGLDQRQGPEGRAHARPCPTGVTHQDRGGQDHASLRADDERENRAKHGLMRALLANMVKGVTDGLRRASSRSTASVTAPRSPGDTINMALGYSHPVVFKLPKGVTAKVDKNTRDRSPSVDRDLLGQTAAKIRELPSARAVQGQGRQVRRRSRSRRRSARPAPRAAAAVSRRRIHQMLSRRQQEEQSRKKRHRSLRKRIEGTAERPRLAVFRSTAPHLRPGRSTTSAEDAR